jgi:hypothetical protein
MDDYYDFGYGDPEEYQSGNSYTGGQSYEDWLFDQDWNDVNSGNYTFDEIANNVDTLDDSWFSGADDSTISTITKALGTVGTKALDALKKQFTDPKTGEVKWRNVAAAAGGLYGLYQSNRPREKTGYQGGIPKYEAVREAVPGSQYDPNRRPGSGGQRYFSNTTYAAPGDAAITARTAAKEEAAGLATLNRDNPANQPRRPTEAAAERGRESEQVREGTAASEVAEQLPAPKYAQGGIAMLAKGGKPRYLGGATDGMADKIPARIDGKQEARLSHGEFVIPADVVGHLGNGNSEAGAQRLYAMMDKIRQARTGSTKQGKQIDPNKFLLA